MDAAALADWIKPVRSVSRTETRDRTGDVRPVRAVVPSRSSVRLMKNGLGTIMGAAGEAQPSRFADRQRADIIDGQR